MNYAADIRTISINRRMNWRFGRNRTFPGDTFAGEIHRADIFGISQHASETGVDEKGLRAGNARAQMARSRKHAFPGDDLNTFDEAAF